jgi:HD-GYP domain-containing protein (c-di-GMP phosphodiesterase class II)
LGGSTSHIALRFAVVSVLAATLVAALAAGAGYQLIRNGEQDAAARSADGLVGAPVRSAVASQGVATAALPLTPDARAQLDALTVPLLSTQLRGIRLWTGDGQVAYATGTSFKESNPPAVSGAELVSRRGTGADGASLFTTYSNSGGYVLEIAQDPRQLDARIQSSQRTGMIVIAVAYVLVCLLMQPAFWLATRKVATEHRRLARLYVTGEELRASLDLHDVVTQISREAATFARADYSLLALFEPETGDLVLRATYNAADGTVAHQQRAIEEWFLRRAVITNTAIVSGQAAKPYAQFFGPDLEAFDQVNVLIAPMSLRNRVVGVVAVVRVPTGKRNAFTPVEVSQTVDLAAQGALAIEQSMLFAKVRAYAKEVELSYDSTLKAMMAALEAKDEVSEGHSERVAKMTVHLARQMGVADNVLVDMERGALLHDVGKIGVPDAVLKKPAALNEMEWEAMRKHPLLAGMMVSKVGFLEGATPILLYHHERYDGGGYPFGLVADKIPLDARIFSVIDAYDAMTSERPYRDAMTHQQAMEEVAAGSGTQFDPGVVTSFTRLMSTHPELRVRAAAIPDRPTYHSDDIMPLREADSSAA